MKDLIKCINSMREHSFVSNFDISSRTIWWTVDCPPYPDVHLKLIEDLERLGQQGHRVLGVIDVKDNMVTFNLYLPSVWNRVRYHLETNSLVLADSAKHLVQLFFQSGRPTDRLDKFESDKLDLVKRMVNPIMNFGPDNQIDLSYESLRPEFVIKDGPKCESFKKLCKDYLVKGSGVPFYPIDHRNLPPISEETEIDKVFAECSTCDDLGTIDVRLGGISTSDSEAPCPDCGGTDTVLHNPQGTPGPCMTCYHKTCPDCKDGYYYPFNGPKEPCKTCTPT